MFTHVHKQRYTQSAHTYIFYGFYTTNISMLGKILRDSKLRSYSLYYQSLFIDGGQSGLDIILTLEKSSGRI